MRPQTDARKSNISLISAAISTYLHKVVAQLNRIADAGVESVPEAAAAASDALPEKAQALRTAATETLPQTMLAQLTAITARASQVLARHRAVLERGIQVLEQTMHGAVARELRARADAAGARGQTIGVLARYAPPLRRRRARC